MKKVLFAAAIVFAGFTTATAQTDRAASGATKTQPAETAAPVQQKVVQQNETRTPVKAEQLPAAVRTSITEMEDTKGWEVVSATHNKGANETYDVVMRKGEETKTVRLDNSGKKVK